jgi:Flp pilus assembly protein TadG
VKNPLAAFRRSEDGGALVEFAASLIVLFTMFFCFFEVALATYSTHLIAELAFEGARYAMVHGSSCPTSSNPTCEVTAAQVNTFVTSLPLPKLVGGTLTANTTYPDGNENPGSRVTVKVSYVFPITMPLVPKSSLHFSTSSTLYIVQ